MALTTHGVNNGEIFMKKVLIGVVVVLVVIGGAGVYVFLNAGGIIKQIVEEVGSEATKTKVSLSEVDLSIQSGEAALKGFQMGNPSGFQTPKAMSFGVVSVKIDPASVTQDVILIKEVVIAKPDITYEFARDRLNPSVRQLGGLLDNSATANILIYPQATEMY